MPFVSFVPSWPLFSVLCSLVCRVSYVEYCQWTVTEENACRALNIERTASPAQIRQAYLDLVKVWHPDRFEHDARLRERAVRSLQDVNEAYTVLQRAASRSRPDATPSEDRTAQASSPFQTSSHAPDRRGHAARRRTDIPATVGGGRTVSAADPRRLADRRRAGCRAHHPHAGASAGRVDGRVNWVRHGHRPAVPCRTRRVASATRHGQAGVGHRHPPGRRHWQRHGIDSQRHSRDAVVRMRSEAGSQRTLYVRRGEKLTMLDVAPGDYHVEMLFGSDWLGRAFGDPAGYVALTAPFVSTLPAPMQQPRPSCSCRADRTCVP